MSVEKAIRDKMPVFLKVALIASIASIVIQGAIKLIWKVDWFDFGINQSIADFYLFKNEIVQKIILQLSLMFNYVIVIAIANKVSIKDIVKRTWWLLILTYLFNYIGKDIATLFIPLGGILISIIYNISIKTKLKEIIKSSAKIILISLILTLYQYITIMIRMNHVPTPSTVYGFYETIIFVLDMYVIAYLYYKLKRRGC
jgi:hypothetical protein